MELEFNQVSVYSVVKWDIWLGIVRIVGRVMTLESILNVLLAALLGMTGDRDVSLPFLTTTPQQEIVQYSDFNMSPVNSTSFFNAATLTSDSADHRERYEVDQGFSLINGLQHFESFEESHIIPTMHAMSFTFSGNLCRVGSLCGGRRQRLCAAGHWSIQIGWRLHDGAICD